MRPDQITIGRTANNDIRAQPSRLHNARRFAPG